MYVDALLSADRFDEAEALYASLPGTRLHADHVTVATFLLQCCSKLRESEARRWISEYHVR